MVAEFQGELEPLSKPPKNPTVDYYNGLLKRDAVATEDVRLSIVARRLAASESDSENQKQLQKELEQLLQDRSTIQAHIHEIAAVSLSTNRANLYQTVVQQRKKITDHDCYKSVTQHVQQKCFDLQNEFVLNKLYIMANLCEAGLRDFTIKNAINVVCTSRLHFEY
ncbi:unnamed protein product [Didymodactylos carnosus]|uniref:Legumain prodomain domain-containing protein n=1 Tax=Didymodactylos carnosus TaxID=1234261 RepID=A0A8S2VRI6_9BILA|nr:unnamed protein product [Didymodactylos carnosus]CAF4414579.1 unnamed protein product [Didymodactylos carnosus]